MYWAQIPAGVEGQVELFHRPHEVHILLGRVARDAEVACRSSQGGQVNAGEVAQAGALLQLPGREAQSLQQRGASHTHLCTCVRDGCVGVLWAAHRSGEEDLKL